MVTYYIGADVHSNNTELAVEQRGKIVARYSVPTTIHAISKVLSGLTGPAECDTISKMWFCLNVGG